LELLEVVAHIVNDNGDSNLGDRPFPPPGPCSLRLRRLFQRGRTFLGLLGDRFAGLYHFGKLRPPVRRQ
jgi:hypothetical protein